MEPRASAGVAPISMARCRSTPGAIPTSTIRAGARTIPLPSTASGRTAAAAPPMAMSAIRRQRDNGFTLLELLLTMALLAFVVSLALPRLDQLYLRFLFWLDQDRVEREIAGLGARAYLEG